MAENLADNRKARFDYEILETFEAGIELLGFEVKSVRQGKLNLIGSYAVIRGGELYLLNSDIPPYQQNNTPENYDSKRTRRLLVHKEELKMLFGKLNEKSYSLVPVRAYSKNGVVKLELGLVRSRKKADKRELLKKRTTEKEIRSEI